MYKTLFPLEYKSKSAKKSIKKKRVEQKIALQMPEIF